MIVESSRSGTERRRDYTRQNDSWLSPGELEQRIAFSVSHDNNTPHASSVVILHHQDQEQGSFRLLQKAAATRMTTQNDIVDEDDEDSSQPDDYSTQNQPPPSDISNLLLMPPIPLEQDEDKEDQSEVGDGTSDPDDSKLVQDAPPTPDASRADPTDDGDSSNGASPVSAPSALSPDEGNDGGGGGGGSPPLDAGDDDDDDSPVSSPVSPGAGDTPETSNSYGGNNDGGNDTPAPVVSPPLPLQPWGDNGGGLATRPPHLPDSPTDENNYDPTHTQPHQEGPATSPAPFPPHDKGSTTEVKLPPKKTNNATCSSWKFRMPCHLLDSIWHYPLSWIVVVLAVYGIHLIRKQRRRQAISAARGEYRQVAARDADRAFDDSAYSPVDDAEYGMGDDDDGDDFDDGWASNNNNNNNINNNNNNRGSIQMRHFGKHGDDDDDGLNLEETNG
ncbi:hypothetical protein ACA910_020745 [Epithemia clementina (nom. ined.)]